MSYSCGCDSYSYPYRAEVRRAKKAHWCAECGRKIEPGERYEYATGKCEGDWFDCHTCPQCLNLREFVVAHVPCVCIEHGNANETLLEAAQEFAHEAPGLLFGTYRLYVKTTKSFRESHT